MIYEIKITRKQRVSVTAREWVKIADTGNDHDNGPRYGYAECPGERQDCIEIYSQVVDSLNLAKVIQAVNGIRDDPREGK